MLIYTTRTTSRMRYIFNLIFAELLGVKYTFTNDIEEFRSFEGVKFNYSDAQIDDELFLVARPLLFKRGTLEIETSVIAYDGSIVFFPTYKKNSIFPFDPFAASFFFVSRYEEYLPHIKDKFGRYDPKESLAYKNGLITKPLVNIWAYEIAKKIKEKYPEFTINPPKYKFIPTIDVDLAFMYRMKGLVRTIGGFVKSLSKADFKEFALRARVLAGREIDPNDTYKYQFDIHKEFGLNPIYFILFANYDIYDKNIPTFHKRFQSLIKTLGDYADVGIHPSYASNHVPGRLKREVRDLSNVLHCEITKSRQHFLKLNLPGTYRNLINLDITDDYTMGYAPTIGFRASICSSFLFYDLENEVETNLRIHPFAFMEGTLSDYMKIQPANAFPIIKNLIDEVKNVNGTLITLWHNDSLSNHGKWIGWRQVYEDMLQYATSK